MSLVLFTWMLTSIERLHQLVARLLIPLWHFLKQLSALMMITTLAMPLGASKLRSVITRYSCRPLVTSRRNRRSNPLRLRGKKSAISTSKHTVSVDEVKRAI
jgi:hypothetical protein